MRGVMVVVKRNGHVGEVGCEVGDDGCVGCGAWLWGGWIGQNSLKRCPALLLRNAQTSTTTFIFHQVSFQFCSRGYLYQKIFPEILFATLWDRPILLWINYLGYPVNLVLSNKVHFNEKMSLIWKISQIEIYIPIKFKHLSCPVVDNVCIVG